MQISLILVSILLITFTGVFAALQNDQISIDTSSQTITSQSIIKTRSNYEVVSETKNNINVTWFPIFVGLVDKEYNITIRNLDSGEKSLDIDAFFKAITGGVDNIVAGSIRLSYLTTLTKTVDEFTESCTKKQIIFSNGEPNKTTREINECIKVNNPTAVTYQGWKDYPVNELRDKTKQEIVLQKTDNNGKITLLPNSVINLNLAFKTRIAERSDGTYGNDGEFGLLLDGILYHPTFNVSYRKRYLINVIANDAIDTNFTHNITFAFTGNSTEIGSGTVTKGNISILACDNVHIIFNETSEIDREIDQCNTSAFSVNFRNQVNMTRNQSLNENYSVYYDPVSSNYQPPRDWGAIYLPPSDTFAAGLNTSRWVVDNTTSTGNSTWINHSGTDGVIKIGVGLDSADDGCFRSQVNISQDNWVLEITYIRNTTFFDSPAEPNNKAYGMNDRPCGGSPNTDANGAFIYGDAPQQRDANFELRTINGGVGDMTTSSFGSKGIKEARWETLVVNRSGTPMFAINRSGISWRNTTGSIIHVSNTGSTSGSGSGKPLRFLLREAIDPIVGNTKEISMVDSVRVYQIMANGPTYATVQQNRTINQKPAVTLNNPPNSTANGSTSHIFNANYSDDAGLKNATLYHNISGSWAANQTIDISGTINSTNFSIANISTGWYSWNIQVCDVNESCTQAISNFTFKVNGSSTTALKVRSCTASTNNFDQGSYDDPCDGNYSIAATCGSNGTINDFLSCDDGNAETHSYNKNRFAGVHIQTFNSSITDCSSIGDVFLCYEWWTSGGDSVNCTIQVDANGNSSYTGLPAGTCPGNTCPFTTPNPGMNCINVTNLENWTCSNFFGNNGTRAVARNLIGKSDIGAETLSTDAFFFNVTYSK